VTVYRAPDLLPPLLPHWRSARVYYPFNVIIAILFAGNQAYLQFRLSDFTDTVTLATAIRRIPYCNENTNTTGGLRLTRTEIFKTANGDRSDVPNVIVLITDGNPNREADLLNDEVLLIKNLSIKIFGVGVTNKVSEL